MWSTPQEGGIGQDRVKERWHKLVESEARVSFWGELVRLKVGNRELENIGENLHEHFRSKIMLDSGKERKLVEQGTSLKWKDEKHYLRELRNRLEEEKKGLSMKIGAGWRYRKIIKNIKRQAKVHKEKEEKRLNKKVKHLMRLREGKEEEKMEN